jgi:hypothetical protein
VSKEIRDRIQNHALQDVSSKNYDRWTYMPEKRVAMEKWNDGSAMRFSLPDPMTARLKVSAQLTASVSNTRLK